MSRRRRRATGSPTSSGEPCSASPSPDELAQLLAGAWRSLAWLLRSSSAPPTSEFRPLSQALLDLAGRHPSLLACLPWLRALAAFSRLLRPRSGAPSGG
ncbi:MAG TPA: hypothetical protein VFD49_09205 [Candidatus Dormibacteraeota bacterium]|nr:hypothetical protein [Candidatus Dormibacteraeota bacterium]